MTRATVAPDRPFDERVAVLLARIGVAPTGASTLCTHGANNRIHRVETNRGVVAVKEYFRHVDDPRDRLASETKFLRYANAVAPGFTPALLAHDPALGLAAMEFVDGRRLSKGDVASEHIDAALSFFEALNAPSARGCAQLDDASESSHSIDGQLAIIDARVARLAAVEPAEAVDTDALEFVGRLRLRWAELATAIRAVAVRDGLDRDGDDAARCVSPSDFGFHNALVNDAGRVRFIDFEYAGWDDVAKTVGDFLAQPAVPVPDRFAASFLWRCSAILPDPSRAAARAQLLRPAYLVKWCCIALNVFLPVHMARRRFANPALEEVILKRAQIALAVQLLDRVDADPL